MPIQAIPDILPAIPEIFLAVMGMVLLMYGVFRPETAGGGIFRINREVSLIGIAFLLVAIVLTIAFTATGGVTFNGLFIGDYYAAFCKVLILIASVFTLLLSCDYMERQNCARFEYTVLVLSSVVGMMMMVSANNLISLYIGVEMQSLALYVVATFNRNNLRSSESGLKYFVLGSVASGMMLYGSSVVYGFSGTTDFNHLSDLLSGATTPPSVGLVIGLVFVIAGLAFKVSAAPFHMWTPDVYEGAPTPVTAFFSVAPKIAALALLVRVMIGPFGDLIDQWRQVIIFISVFSMFVGAFAAIAQTNIKRLMAYSSIGHVGYALIGLAAGSESGIQGILVYLTIYLFMNLGIFACILVMKRDENMVENISDLAGFGKSHPWSAAALTAFMFSMAGIPPLAGFFGKLYIFLPAIEAGLVSLAIIGVITSVISAFYYLRIIKIMYFDDMVEPLDKYKSGELTGVIAMTGGLITFFWILPAPLLNIAEKAAVSLF